MSWELFPRSLVQRIWKGDYWEIIPKVQKLPRQAWVDKGWVWNGNAAALPTFTRALPSSKPPRQPAGLAEASEEAKMRWAADEFCFQVYQYESDVMLTSLSDSSLRLPSIEEREILMGFDRGYTKAAVSEKLSVRAAFVQQAQQIGNSFACNVVSFLISDLLCQLSFVSSPLPLELGNIIGTAPEPWSHSMRFCKANNKQEGDKDKDLVWQYLRRAERGGTDVRLDVGIPFRSKAWPRAGLNSNFWFWHIIHGYPWPERSSAHINLYELVATLNCIRWRLRKSSQLNTRFLHLIDNQVVASILTKGRTSSLALRHSLRKLNSYILAANVYPAFGFINSEDNPADIPSRWSSQKRKRDVSGKES